MTEKPADHGSGEPARVGATPPHDEPEPPRYEADHDIDPGTGHDVTRPDPTRPVSGDEPAGGGGSTDDTKVLPSAPPPAAIGSQAPGSGTLPLPADGVAGTAAATPEPVTEQVAAPGPAAAGGDQPAAPPTEPGFGPPAPPGGFPPPPPGGFPPPSGGFFPPPQPTGGAFATKYGLVRPRHGRWFAGVAAAIGRATNTDPVLWRVLLAVLTLFGGVGLLVYLLGWMLIPSEGDSASPGEALIGRGHSSASAPFALGLGILTVITFAGVFSGDMRSALLGVAVIVGAALLVSRGGRSLGRPAGTMPAAGGPLQGPPMAGAPFAGTAPTAPFAGAAPTEAPGGYRPPFAPHGPYASTSPYAQSLGYATPPPPQYPGLAPTAPPPPKPPRERSRLGRVTLSLICLALGVLAVIDVSGASSLPASAYVAAPLGVVGVGLLIGTWLGRARWLIIPGLVLSLALLIVGSAERWNFERPSGSTGDVTWAPASATDLQSSYRVNAGNGTLDLSKVDFRGAPATVNVQVDLGNLVVILPPDVDVDVTAKVQGGDANVLGQQWGGFGNDSRQVRDNGTDGPGGGQLQLTANVDLGKLEVHR
jgi:phage shock protein PspC (stress-responsive transcriptional regulator)